MNALKKAGLPFFLIYYLRHTFVSRLTSAGVFRFHFILADEIPQAVSVPVDKKL